MLLPRCPRLITRDASPVAQASRLGLRLLALIAIALCAHSPALAQLNPTPGAPSLPLLAPGLASGVQNRITYQHGIEFVTIGAPGNAAWAGNNLPGDMAVGRGSVGYEYRIGRYEITTTQWVEFMNAAFDRPTNDRLPWIVPPDSGNWGATSTSPTVPGGSRWRVPAGNELRGVGDISWRMAAMYCNWLHNDKSTARSAFLNGAYDVSTFGSAPQFGFTDQITRNANAKFFIPSWDEWLKAAHFDPNKNGPGQAGWWQYNITQDLRPAYGPPGVNVTYGNVQPGPDPSGPLAQANSGWAFEFPGFNAIGTRLGAYANVAQSPWGLLDTAGGTREWTEGTMFLDPNTPVYRMLEGSAWLDSPGNAIGNDWIGANSSEAPFIATFDFGFRIAAVVPAPSCGGVLILLGCVSLRRRRRQAWWH